MASLLLAPIVEVFRLILAPIAPFTWLGLPFSTLDTVAALRLCVALRQFREKLARDHALKLKTMSGGDPEKEKERAAIREMEQRSFVRDAAASPRLAAYADAYRARRPDASAAIARRLAAKPLFQAIRAFAAREWRRQGYFRLLNRMLFLAGRPERRWRVMQRFYGLGEPLIERFYAGQLTGTDKARILMGKPPVPLGEALKAVRLSSPQKIASTSFGKRL